jgi:hypothetical protein
MRPAGERAERNRTEPTGIEVSIANDDTLCSPVWEALFKAANRPCTTTTI